MTLKLMQGFESCRDDTDFRLQGWQGVSPLRTGFPPSITNVAGTSMHIIGPGSAPAAAPGASGATDPGYYNTGVTVNQAWTAGGFTFGSYMKINSRATLSYGSGSSANANQACWDGSKYWALQYNGSVYNVVTSTNLQTWTVTPNQPGGAASSLTSIYYMGSGVVALLSTAGDGGENVIWYTSNSGATWQSQTLASPGFASNNFGSAIATGNASFPHAVSCHVAGTTGTVIATGGLFVGTLGGTMTEVITGPASTGYSTTMRPRINSGIISLSNCGGATFSVLYSATASNASLNTAGAWSTASFSGSYSINDITYNPVSNVWVLATTAGLYTFANTGAAGTAVAPTGSPTVTQRYSTVGMQNVWWTGTQLVAIGQSGHIVTSPDGLTWTESGGHIIQVGTSGYNWQCSIYDGTQYVLFSDATTGVIATTPDLVSNYAAQYIQDGAIGGASNNWGIVGVYSGTAPSGGAWSPNQNYAGLNIGTPSGGSCSMSLSNFNTNYTSFSVSTTPSFGHYYEMVFTPTATANTFNVAVYVDGTVVQNYTNIAMAASTSDTTSLLVIVLDRRNSIVAYDDMYFTVNDGLGIVGPLGAVNIIARRPSTDVQAQWVKNGSAASNSLSVRQPAFSSQSANYVSSGSAGDKDIYSSSDTIPAGFTPKAVLVEGVFTRTSTTAPSVNVGIISGSTESDSTNASLATNNPTYVSQIYQTNPNGGTAWNAAAVLATELVANHVT